MKRILAIGIILLFIGMSISSSTGFNVREQTNTVSNNGKTLYVGGSGPGNYTKIQDAIDDAPKGATIFVYRGIYNECINIHAGSIRLIGEDKNSTIIDGKEFSDVIELLVDNVSISGFTIKNSGEQGSGIFIKSIIHIRKFSIFNNNIVNNKNGIFCYNSSNISIFKNNISNNNVGLKFLECEQVKITENILFNNSFYGTSIRKGSCVFDSNYVKNSYYGLIFNFVYNCHIQNNRIENCYSFNLQLGPANDNIVTENIFMNSSTGLDLNFCNNTDIIKNGFYNNTEYGIEILKSSNTNVLRNNFVNNNYYTYLIDTDTFFNYNYWGRMRLLPKPILELKLIVIFNWFSIYFPKLVFDDNPVQEPYDIEV